MEQLLAKKTRAEAAYTRVSARMRTSQRQEDVHNGVLAQQMEQLDILIEEGTDPKAIASCQALYDDTSADCAEAAARTTGLLADLTSADLKTQQINLEIATHRQQEDTVITAAALPPPVEDTPTPSSPRVDLPDGGAAAAAPADAHAGTPAGPNGGHHASNGGGHLNVKKPDGAIITLEVTGQDTVEIVKNKILERAGFPTAEQRLTLSGSGNSVENLADDTVLADVEHGGTLMLVLCVPAEVPKAAADVLPAEMTPAMEVDDGVATADRSTVSSDEEYASVRGSGEKGDGSLGDISLPEGSAPRPVVPTRDMDTTAPAADTTLTAPFRTDVSDIEVPADLHTRLNMKNTDTMHHDRVQVFVTVATQLPDPENEDDRGKDSNVRALVLQLGLHGRLVLPTLPAKVKSIDTGSSAVLHSVHVDGSAFHNIGVEPMSQHAAGDDPELLLAVIGCDVTDSPDRFVQTAKDSAPGSEGRGILVVSAGMDYMVVDSLSNQVQPGTPDSSHFLPGTDAPASHWSYQGVTYVAIPFDELLNGNTMMYHGNFCELMQYCSISSTGFHPMGAGRLLNMMPENPSMQWSPAGETVNGKPVDSPSSALYVPFADATGVSMINEWVRQACHDLGLSAEISYSSFGEKAMEQGGLNIASVPQHRTHMIMTLSAVSLLAHLVYESDFRSPSLPEDTLDGLEQLRSTMLEVTRA